MVTPPYIYQCIRKTFITRNLLFSFIFDLYSDPECQVIACDVTNKYEEFAKKFWKKAGVEDKIQLRVAPGRKVN